MLIILILMITKFAIILLIYFINCVVGKSKIGSFENMKLEFNMA